jgi:hypothetical protein
MRLGCEERKFRVERLTCVMRSVTCIEGSRERDCGGRDTPGFRAYAALSVTNESSNVYSMIKQHI